MTGRAKIEELIHSWYGFYFFSAIFSFLVGERSIGLWSIFRAAIGLGFAWFVTFVIGRALLRRSSLTRALLLLTSGLLAALGGLSTARSVLSFVQHWELGVLASAIYYGVSMWMNAKSFRTLTDPAVKAYFG